MGKLDFSALIIPILFFALLFSGVGDSLAFKLLDEPLEVTGFAENWTAFHTEENPKAEAKSGDFARCRNTLQIEGEYKLLENVSLHGIWRGYHEASFDLDHDLDQRPRDELLRHSEMREIYLTLATGDWAVRLGKQQVRWGESDLLRVADVINPLDLRWCYILAPWEMTRGEAGWRLLRESWEEIGIPLWMADISYAIAPDLSLEIVWIPEDFQPFKLAPEGANYSLGIPQSRLDLMEAGEPEKHSLRNTEAGIRLKGVFQGWELSLFDFYTWDKRNPVCDDGFRYKRKNIIGGTFNKYDELTRAVYRGEFTLNMREPYNNTTLDRVFRKESLAYMIGIDKPTPCPFRTGFVFISVQLFQKYILNWDKDDGIRGADMSEDKSQTILTLILSTGFKEYRIIPQVLLAYDADGNGLVQPQLHWRRTDYCTFVAQANIAWGNTAKSGYFGPIRETDEISFRVRLSW